MKYIFIIALFLVATSCKNSESAFEKALHLSKNNRSEIEKIVQHYSKIGDYKKKDAAIFLISNMMGMESFIHLDEKNKDSLLSYIANLKDTCSWDPQYSILVKTIDSISQRYPQSYKKVLDLEIVNANYIINNIDKAFEVWDDSNWKNDYTDNVFYNYVLPYKIEHEEIEDWRIEVMNDKIALEDSIKNSRDIYCFAKKLADHSFVSYNIGMSYLFAPFGYRDIKKIGIGTCVHAANMTVYYNRSRGIPSAIDFTPAWANRGGSHLWSSVILPNKKSKGIYHNENGTNDFQYKLSKVYRRTFEIQPKLEIELDEEIPAFFLNRNIIDVTDEYDMPTSTITITDNGACDAKFIYLSTFNNKIWIPVAYAKRDKKKSVFRNVGRGVLPDGNDRMIKYIDQGNGILFLPIFSLQEGNIPAAHPFILDTLGGITKIIASDMKENVRLFRKYPKSPKFAEAEKALVGGVFEAANKLDFSDSEVLCTIKKEQRHPLASIKVGNNKKFKYVRFTPPHEAIAMIAELQFFDKFRQKISGRSEDGKEQLYSGEQIFDGNLLTWLYKTGNYTAHFIFSFNSASEIQEIKFSSRTDENDIMIGEDYELFYWNDKWVSLGRKIASDYYLDFEVPKTALFLLRNHTKGVEERIFTIENGTQVWW